MIRSNRRGRATLERLERLRQHTTVFGQILRDLWPLAVDVLAPDVTLRQRDLRSSPARPAGVRIPGPTPPLATTRSPSQSAAQLDK